MLINPMERHGRTGTFRTKRSQVGEFRLHDCIPGRVRKNTHGMRHEYALLARIGEEFAECLRSTSKAHLQRILLFFDLMIHVTPSVLPNGYEGRDAEERWSLLRHVTAHQWLENYQLKRSGANKCGFALFSAEVRNLRLLHSKILNAAQKQLITIPPLKRAGMNWTRKNASSNNTQNEGDEGDINNSSNTSFGSTTGGSSEAECAARAERTALRSLLANIQNDVCVQTEATVESEVVYALSPAEVRRVLAAADGRQERLVVMLFMTWALRIGGLCRLQLTNGVLCTTIKTPMDVPDQLVTIEKNGKVRKIGPLNEICRILIAEWCLHDRQPVGTSYLFPSTLVHRAFVTNVCVWQLCRTMYNRAGLSGDHIHPHAFRHTVVHMMRQCGATFEVIAKWIGHSSVKITANIYGRLRQEETNDMIAKFCPHIATSSGANYTTDWKALATHLQNPFNMQLSTPLAVTSNTKPRRDDVKDRARQALKG